VFSCRVANGVYMCVIG